MKAEQVYYAVFCLSLVALYYADTPKGMAIAALVGACSFVLAALTTQEKQNEKMRNAISRIWDRLDPSRSKDE